MNTWITYKDFEIKNLGKYHDLYLQSDTLLLADIFDNFRNMCLEIYKLDPARFPTAPELVWHAVLEKKKVKLDLLTIIDVLLVVEELSGNMLCRICYDRYVKVINKYIKDYDKNKESS